MKKYNRNNNFYIIILLIALILFFLLFNNNSCFENFEVASKPIDLKLHREINVDNISSDLDTTGANEQKGKEIVENPSMKKTGNNIKEKLNK